MSTLRAMLLSLLTVLLVTACGDRAVEESPSSTEAGSQTPATTTAAPPSEDPAREAAPAVPLTPRSTPLEVGAIAPSFKGLPTGKAVVVFYRGHW